MPLVANFGLRKRPDGDELEVPSPDADDTPIYSTMFFREMRAAKEYGKSPDDWYKESRGSRAVMVDLGEAEVIITDIQMKDAERKAELAAGYLRLAYWQANVGEAPRTLDSSSIDLDAEPMHFAEELLTHGERPEHWRDIVDAEKDVLRKELQTLGITV